jgi:uncharacterized membrane protein YdjX (TVP38/TMEM64 family)
VFIFIYLIVYNRGYLINIKNLRNYIIKFGSLGFVVLLIIYSLKPVIIFFPTVALTILAGNIYGFLVGFLLTLLGLFLSASFAFYVSRNLGYGFINRITKGKLLHMNRSAKDYGLKLVFIMRLSTVFPYDILSYAVGLTNINYKDFILGSILGAAPEMLVYSYLGQNALGDLSKKIYIPIVTLVAMSLLGRVMYKKYSKDY